MPKSPKSAPPRSNLTLEQHWQIIQYKKEHPTLSTAEIARVFAEKFNHPTLNQSTVSRTLNKEDRLRPFSNHTTRKKISQVRCPEVEEALMKWYSVEMEQGNVVTGPMLRSQAIKIADDMGIPEDQRPKYSNGWLDCYKSRHQLKFGNRPQSNSHSQSQRGSPASSSVGSSAPTTTSSSLGSAHVQIQSRLAAQQQSLQQSQVQVPPHLHRPATLATSSLTPAPSSAPAHSLPTPHSPFYTSPTLHMKSEPSEPDLDVDVDADADGDADEDLETDSDISGTSYPSRSPSCCSYGGYPAYAYPSYPPSYSTSHPHSHSHRHSHSYPSYTSSNAYQCSACPPPHHLPHPSTTATTTTTTNHSIPPQQEDEISRAVKSLKLHLESCPTLAPNRGNLLANMKVIECAVSDCRSSIGDDDDEDGDAELEQRMDVAVSGRVMGGVVIPRSHSHSRSQEPLSPLSPISTTIDSIPRPTTTGGVSVPPRRQRWLDLVTSPTDSDYSNSHSHSNPGSVGGSPASTSMVH